MSFQLVSPTTTTPPCEFQALFQCRACVAATKLQDGHGLYSGNISPNEMLSSKTASVMVFHIVTEKKLRHARSKLHHTLEEGLLGFSLL